MNAPASLLPAISRASRTTSVVGLVMVLFFLAPGALHAQDEAPDTRPVIRTEADLPRYTYSITPQKPSELLSDAEAFDVLAQAVQADLVSLLDQFVVEDNATLRSVYGVLEGLALLRGDHEAALAYAATIRELQEKSAERLLSGLVTEAVVAAAAAGDDPSVRRTAFREAYAGAIHALPWEVVQDAVEETKGRMELFSENLIVGMVQSQYDPAASETGSVSGEVARTLINMRAFKEVGLPYRDEIISVLDGYITANRVEKPNIWAIRDVVLDAEEAFHPVVVAIWDSGVDADVFGTQAFRNESETLNGKDDDQNGFVDDLHGIAYELWGREKHPDVLYPLGEGERARLSEMKDQMKGLQDLRASIDSPEAQALKRKMAALPPDSVGAFIEELGLFTEYAHGTHVAGIAVAGNPFARVLAVRETFPYQVIPPPLTKDDAERWAAHMQVTVDYLKRHNARVVNMSWGFSAKDLEHLFEVNGMGADAGERQAMAAEVFEIMREGFERAMGGAPEILFVPAAGNSDEDVSFTVGIPAAIALPNVLTVGAVDQAGEETSFTSYGGVVRVHASGFEVESYLPGGERLAWSGTSMSAPNVTNLAAKLFSIDPSLTPEAVVDLILAAADRSEDGRRVLINPKRTVEQVLARAGG